jgi:serine O-acetyltransferase
MPHLNGIFIHENASLGNNCTIFQQVTIGSNEHKDNPMSAPQIGNGVYIGAGAKILGDISIGDNVRIGANAVVTKSVPANVTVVGYNRVLNRL